MLKAANRAIAFVGLVFGVTSIALTIHDALVYYFLGLNLQQFNLEMSLLVYACFFLVSSLLVYVATK